MVREEDFDVSKANTINRLYQTSTSVHRRGARDLPRRRFGTAHQGTFKASELRPRWCLERDCVGSSLDGKFLYGKKFPPTPSSSPSASGSCPMTGRYRYWHLTIPGRSLLRSADGEEDGRRGPRCA